MACSGAATEVAPGRRSSSESASRRWPWILRTARICSPAGHAGSSSARTRAAPGRRQQAARTDQRQRDRVRPRSPGRRVRRRMGSRRDPKQRRWHHLAPNRTPPRMDRNDRRRPTRIRDALRQLQRCAPPQHRWGLLLEMALHSHVGAVLGVLAIDPSDPQTLYASIGDASSRLRPPHLAKSIDGGKHWRFLKSGTHHIDATAVAIEPRDPNTMYAATQFQGVLRTTDGGATWRPFNTGLPARAINTVALDRTGSHTLRRHQRRRPRARPSPLGRDGLRGRRTCLG